MRNLIGFFRRMGRFGRRMWPMVYPYWHDSEEKWSARGLLVAVIGLNLFLVWISVQFNSWYNEFYNVLQQVPELVQQAPQGASEPLPDQLSAEPVGQVMDEAALAAQEAAAAAETERKGRLAELFGEFWYQIGVFGVLATVSIATAVYKFYLQMSLQMRWRRWLTNRYLARWLEAQRYYRLELDRNRTDNPDQRISQDVDGFTGGTLGLVLGVLDAVVTLFSFVFILWTISGPLSFTLPGTEFDVTIPGYMVWVAVLYAGVGTWLVHKIGRPLIPLNFHQERLEANFRFDLVRVRENAEGIALYRGEADETRSLQGRFAGIWDNYWNIVRYQKRLVGYRSVYSQVAIIFPFLVGAPRYFAGAIQLGGLMQISNAFGKVQDALSWFIDAYAGLASWKATVDRLITFEQALDELGGAVGREALPTRPGSPGQVAVEQLTLSLPDGQTLLGSSNLQLRGGENLMISGVSGSGKSTLFRALAGIWPWASGEMKLPPEESVLFLPQQPYLPIGTLRQALSYPSADGRFSDDALKEVLEACQLPEMTERLDEEGHWAKIMSPGEQQRLAFARALLQQPHWLFLDEASSALDVTNERRMFKLLKERMPDTTLVSIAHRTQLAEHHPRQLQLVPGEGLVEQQPEPSPA